MDKFELWYPLDNWTVTQPFGANDVPLYRQIGMAGHNGIDAFAYDGQIVRAAHDGVVLSTGTDKSGGEGIVLLTAKEFLFKNAMVRFKTQYWHLRRHSYRVKPGDVVTAGQIIAQADNTGISTGSHLHFGVKPVVMGKLDWENIEQKNGYFGAVNPQRFLNGCYAKDAERVTAFLKSQIEILKTKVSLLINKK